MKNEMGENSTAENRNDMHRRWTENDREIGENMDNDKENREHAD